MARIAALARSPCSGSVTREVDTSQKEGTPMAALIQADDARGSLRCGSAQEGHEWAETSGRRRTGQPWGGIFLRWAATSHVAAEAKAALAASTVTESPMMLPPTEHRAGNSPGRKPRCLRRCTRANVRPRSASGSELCSMFAISDRGAIATPRGRRARDAGRRRRCRAGTARARPPGETRRPSGAQGVCCEATLPAAAALSV